MAYPHVPRFQPNSIRISASGRPQADPLMTTVIPEVLPAYFPNFMAELPAGATRVPQLGLYDLIVAAGRSLPVQLDSAVSRVSVTNPEIADAMVISPEEILINGIAPGNTSMVLWFKAGGIGNYNVIVETDPAPLQMRLRQFFPTENIHVGASRQTIVLYGSVSRPEVGEKVVRISSDYSPNVVSNLTYPPEGRKQVMLKVIFAEVNREAITELSSSFSRIDPSNPRSINEGLSATGGQTTSGNVINTPLGPDFAFNENINFYAFSFGEKLATFITALKTRGLLQVLAEPTLIAADGEKASFLAGGEFPIPVAQAGAGFTSVTIVFKKFGISLEFTPQIRQDGAIVLQVEPEVSALDFANAVVLSGFTVPSLTVRRASTQIDLQSGQSFAIAGLYSSDLQQTRKKIPILGDIPLLGYLFRSKNLKKRKSELLVMVTPTLVEPIPHGEEIPLPKFPESFDLDKKKKNKQEESTPTADVEQQ
jgi:pilus assembly protein CpaC